MSLTLEIAGRVQSIDAQSWDALTGGMPLLSHAFLSAMETSNSVGHGTGWQPCPMLVHDDGQLVGAIPLYVKSHSYGEYVFDWSWAEAYQRNGLNYYPKLIAAIPFSPVTSARILVADVANADSIQAVMLQALLEAMYKHQYTSYFQIKLQLKCSGKLAGWSVTVSNFDGKMKVLRILMHS